MRIDVYQRPSKEIAEDLWRIEKMVGTTLKAMEVILSSFQDLKDAQAATVQKMAALKADIEALKASQGMTQDEQASLDEAVTNQNSINDTISAVDAEVKPAS